MKTKRVGEIDFWRFVFSLIIVLLHIRTIVGEENCLFNNGAYAVEFFFILSGYLLMGSIERARESSDSIAKDTFRFIKKKYLSFCPEVVVVWVLCVVLTIVLLDKDLGESVRIFMGGIWETLLLNITGLWFVKLNNAVWYLSAMLLCMAIIYPLLRKYKNASIYVILPLAMVLIYGWMYKISVLSARLQNG